MRAPILLLLVTSALACSDPTAVRTETLRSTANSLAASWSEVQTWRGMSIQMSLGAADTTLRGSGTYRTIGQTGAIPRITGYVVWQDSAFVPSGGVMPAHPEVVLDLAFDKGLAARFDQGVLLGHDTLSGGLTFSDSTYVSYGTSFARRSVQGQ